MEDGKHEKTVNLELKEEFKKGGFGKGTVGAGTDDRLMAKMNYNKFDKKNQFAIVGLKQYNQSGLSNNDYQDFREVRATSGMTTLTLVLILVVLSGLFMME
ncbi:MAG: hypothetical protein IPH28_16850 [Cytophagaceae bacterium]|nr:hypothetical protein [Cytophagaceae bacterium]